MIHLHLFSVLGSRFSVLGSLLISLLISPTHLFAQQSGDLPCLEENITYEEFIALLETIGPMPSSGPVLHNIPVWFYVVRDEIEPTNFSTWNDFFAPKKMLNQLNGHFDNSAIGIQFYMCGYSTIESDEWVELEIGPESSDLINYAKQINPNYENVLNVFLTRKINGGVTSGTYGRPSANSVGQIFVAKEDVTFSHEAGHYFGLNHTHSTPFYSSSAPQLTQFVNSPVTIIINGSPITLTCHETGDFLCDTPADPTLGSTFGCDFDNNCIVSTCNPATDPLGVTYNPDPTLLMSYYGECRYRFSSEQMQIMSNLINAGQYYEFLRDGNVPDCATFNASDHGYIRHICQNPDIMGSSPAITPVKGVKIEMGDALNQPCNASIETNNNGLYTTFQCVYPYQGAGPLSILPDINYPYPLNGVTTYDLLLIYKHILATQFLPTPFQIIAADANNSGSITPFDVVEIRKLILGVYLNFPNNSNWRYIPEACLNNQVFADAFFDPNTAGTIGNNPFDAVWVNPEDPLLPNGMPNIRTYSAGPLPLAPNNVSWMDHITMDVNGVPAQDPDNWSFWSIKVGDVNCNADLNGAPPPANEPEEFFSAIPHQTIAANSDFILSVKGAGDDLVAAWQIGIDFDENALQILEIMPGNSGEAFTLDNFGLTEIATGKIRTLNFSTTGDGFDINNKSLFNIRFKALQPIAGISQFFQLNRNVLIKRFYSEEGSELESFPLLLEVNAAPIGFQNGTTSSSSLQSRASFNVQVYPSPFKDEFTFECFTAKEETANLCIYDATGTLIVSKNVLLTAGLNTIPFDGLAKQPKGLYWFCVTAGIDKYSNKLIKN